MKAILFSLILSVTYCSIQAQQMQKCHTDEYVNELNAENPGLKAQMHQVYEIAKAKAAQSAGEKALGDWDTIFRFPVVFHVVYNTPEENISDELLFSQLSVMNEDFRRLNADTVNTRTEFVDRAGDAGMEFYLATLDPDGNPTTGITRTSTSTPVFSFLNLDAIKSSSTGGIDGWDPNEYINVWIGDFGGVVLGFAYPPEIAPNWPNGQVPSDESVWGVAMHYEVVGYENPLAVGALSIADKGRTMVHEMGHFLGLRHIWGDAGGPFGGVDCDVAADDGLADTPHAGSNSQAEGCDFTKNSCVFETPDEPDMVENFMDYSTEACQNMFTDDQIRIMRSMAVIGRPGLAFILSDAVFDLSEGDYLIINGDTVIIDPSTNFAIQIGDTVLFLMENNGYEYIATATSPIGIGLGIQVNEDGEIIGSINPDGIRENLAKSFSLYPNPAASNLTINLNNEEIDVLKIVDLSGRIINEIAVMANEFEVITDDLESGMYYFCFSNAGVDKGIKKALIAK